LNPKAIKNPLITKKVDIPIKKEVNCLKKLARNISLWGSIKGKKTDKIEASTEYIPKTIILREIGDKKRVSLKNKIYKIDKNAKGGAIFKPNGEKKMKFSNDIGKPKTSILFF